MVVVVGAVARRECWECDAWTILYIHTLME